MCIVQVSRQILQGVKVYNDWKKLYCKKIRNFFLKAMQKISPKNFLLLSIGVGSGGKGGRAPWICILGTDKVEGGLMVLFFLVFRFPLPLENFSADALAVIVKS